MYTIVIDYSNKLTFKGYDDFVNALGYLFQGGITKDIKVCYEKEEKDA